MLLEYVIKRSPYLSKTAEVAPIPYSTAKDYFTTRNIVAQHALFQ